MNYLCVSRGSMARMRHIVYVCLPLLGVLLWPVCAQNLQEYGRVTPGDPFVFEGDTLVLYCNITNEQVRENSSRLYFDRTTQTQQGPIPQSLTEILTTKAIRIRIPRMELEDEGTYVCKQRLLLDNGSRIIGSQFVTVDRRPKPVQNISCVVYNWERMTCTWDLGVDYQHLDNVNVTLVYAEVQAQYDCPILTQTSCTWDTHHYSHGHDYKIIVFVNYIFQKKKLEGAKSGLERIQTKLLIKPDPVTSLTPTVLNSTCVELSWDHSQIDIRKDEIFFIGQYRSQWSTTWHHMHTVRGELHTIVCRLIPFTEYKFVMYVMPQPEHTLDTDEQGYGSESVEVTVKTFEDVPVGKPNMCPGCFYCRDSKMCESATIYWGDIPPAKRHGTITRYRFELQNGPQHISNTTKEGIDLHSTTLDLPAQVPVVQVLITPGTNVGFGIVSSTILIPTADKRPQPPSMFLVQTDKNADKIFYLSWAAMPLTVETALAGGGEERKARDVSQDIPKEVTDGKYEGPKEKVTSIFVVWCVGSRMAFDCETPIQSTRLLPDQVTHELEVENLPVHKDRILIGITKEVTRNGQVLSSGIHWADCVYLRDHDPPGPPQNVRFAKEQSPNQLYVVWDKIGCGMERAYVIEYHVKYCVAPNGTVCSAIEPSRTKNVSSIKGEAVLRDLQPNQLYMVRVRAVSSIGYGEYSPPVVHRVVQHPSDSGQDDSKQTVYGAIGGAIILFLFFIIFLAYFFWRCKRRKSKLQADERIEPYAETSNPGYNEKNNPARRSGSSSEDNGSDHSHQPLIVANNNKTNKENQPLKIGESEKALLKENYERFICVDRKPIPTPVLINGYLPKSSKDVIDSKLGDINEEKDSSGVLSHHTESQKRTRNSDSSRSLKEGYSKFGYNSSGKSRSHSTNSGSSSEPSESYRRVVPMDDNLTCTILSTNGSSVPGVTMHPRNPMVSAQLVYQVAPRPMLGMSSLDTGRDKTKARKLSLQTVVPSSDNNFDSANNVPDKCIVMPALLSNGYQPNGTTPSDGYQPHGTTPYSSDGYQSNGTTPYLSDGYQPNGTLGERAETPVWQLRDDLTELEPPSSTIEGYSKINEAPTLERGREGLFSALMLDPSLRQDTEMKSSEIAKQSEQNLVPAASPVKKLGGYVYLVSGDDNNSWACPEANYEQSHDRELYEDPDHKANSMEFVNSSNEDRTDLSCEPSGVFPHRSPDTRRLPPDFHLLSNGYTSIDGAQIISNDHSPHTPSSVQATNDLSPQLSMHDQNLYLIPVESRPHSSSLNSLSSQTPLPHNFVANIPPSPHHTVPSSPTDRFSNLQSVRPINQPAIHNHRPPPSYPPPPPPALILDENDYEDAPPQYPAPPPPRNLNLNALAVPSNNVVNRPLSGVLLDLPLQYYEEPQTDGTLDIQTEL